MKIFLYLLRQSRLLLSLATLTSLITGLSGAGLATLIGRGITGTVTPGDAWLFFGLCLAFVLSRSSSEITLIHIVQNIILRLRIDLSRQILGTPLKKLQTLGKSQLFAIMTNDISVFVQAFQALPMILGNISLVTACFAYMAWLSWQLFLMFAAVLVSCMVGYQFAVSRALSNMVQLRAKLNDLYRHFDNLLDGTRELQLNARRGTHFIDKVIRPDAHIFRRLFVGAMSIYTSVTNLGLIVFYMVIGFLLFILPHWGAHATATLSTFALTLLFLVRPITDLMNAIPNLRQAGISLQHIERLEHALGAAEPAPDGPDPFRGHAPLSLTLRGTRHHYSGPTEDGSFMLGPLDLDIQAGEIIYIIGGNGSGKTTLAMLLLGFYEPEAGEIRLNGELLTQQNLPHYRQYFSAVFSDFHLFEQLLETEEVNLSQRAEQYVKKLQMAHKVTVADGKFSTTDLSSGQRKRLALVSSYLEDRAIYVFDEWAADQDPAFKQIFYTELLPELKLRGKTVVIITHDDAYFRYADRLIKLENGHLRPVSRTGQAVEETEMVHS